MAIIELAKGKIGFLLSETCSYLFLNISAKNIKVPCYTFASLTWLFTIILNGWD